MWNLFGQSSFDYEYTVTTVDGADAGIFAGMFFLWMLVWLAFVVVLVVAMWKIFEKAGEQGWKSIIPIYNYWTLCEIVGKPGWWSLVFLIAWIPFFGWIAAIAVAVIVALELGKGFGKDTVWSVFLLVLFSVIGYLILGFGSDKFDKSRLSSGGTGPTASTGNDAAGAPPTSA